MLQCYILMCGRSVTAFLVPPFKSEPGARAPPAPPKGQHWLFVNQALIFFIHSNNRVQPTVHQNIKTMFTFLKSNCMIIIPCLCCMYSCRTAIHAVKFENTSIRAYENIKTLKYTILSYKTVMQQNHEWWKFVLHFSTEKTVKLACVKHGHPCTSQNTCMSKYAHYKTPSTQSFCSMKIGPLPFPKQVLHTVRYSISSVNLQYFPISLRSCSSWLHIRACLLSLLSFLQ
jgi:hypothetical protein